MTLKGNVNVEGKLTRGLKNNKGIWLIIMQAVEV